MNNLYMYAIVPPPKETPRFQSEREIFAEKYNCVKALKPPVHITLFEPFYSDDELTEQIDGIQQWVSTLSPFRISARNYNYFKNRQHPVVYIDVEYNERLNTLHKTFLAQLRNFMTVPQQTNKYTPHFTIGYRDVQPGMMPQIIDEYSRRRFDASFEVSSFYLWKHDRINWRPYKEFRFGASQPEQQQLSLF